MALETGTYINELNSSNPQSTDSVSQADDHIRLIKATIKATFPNVTGAVTKSHTELNALAPLASPVFTGTPEAPTASPGTNTTQLSTTAFVTAAITAAVSATKEALYPVGSIYTNATSSTNPGTLLGFGTWVAFGAGRVMVGLDATDPLFDTAEETGGSKDAIAVSHTHTFSATTSSNGAHTHNALLGTDTSDVGPKLRGAGSSATSGTGVTESNGAHTHTISGTTASTGSSGTNANLPPYITVYMWKRTA